MDNQNQNNFLDGRTLLAVMLVIGIFVGWQTYLKQKYGNQPAAAVATDGKTEANQSPQAAAPTPQTSGAANEAAAPTPAPTLTEPAAQANTVEEKRIPFENKNISFELSSKGMGLKNLTIRTHTDRNHEPVKMGQSEVHSLFEVGVVGQTQPLDFQITQKSENEFEGVAQFGESQIRRVIRINPETEGMENTVTVDKVTPQFPGIVVKIPEKGEAHSGGSLLSPSFELQEFIVIHSGEEERIISSSSSEKIEKTFPTVSLLGIGTQYFTSSMLDKSDIIPEAHVFGGQTVKGEEVQIHNLLAQMIYKPAPGKDSMNLNWISYSGGKSVATLEKIDPQLGKVLDLGFFATIGNWLLKIMRWLYTIFGNWGVSIILLTLMVRILVLPLNVSTFKSTKKMQKLQPVIASLRTRYKDDPQAMNREMMNVWKEHKVNPLGGCLPMLLQLPIFFALYRVLGQSIELYQAPFFGWIQDLSLKDPYYVLPVLMAICMYIQQKITPTTMDPNQAKVMQFLPLVFALMMVSLPSGLTLYIFINTLAGIILQQLFMRDSSKSVTAKEAKA